MRSARFWKRITAAALIVPLLALTGIRAAPEPDDPEARIQANLRGFVADRFAILLQVDEALSRAAREHSEILATRTHIDTHEFLRQALSDKSVLDPFPYVFYGSGPPDKLSEIEQRLYVNFAKLPLAERRLYTHLGVGVHRRRTRTLLRRRDEMFISVLMTQRAVSFAPLPQDIQPGDAFEFEGEIHAPFRDPEVLLTQPDGRTLRLENYASDPQQFRVHVRLGTTPGEYQLEVMGRYDMGPRVLALCGLFARTAGQPLQYERLLLAARNGTLEPAKARPATTHNRTEREAEIELLRLVNRDRDRAGLEPLAESAVLSALARGHAIDMRQRRFFAHVSPNTGRLADRAERAGIRYRRLAENIAIGEDVHEAQRALMRSPGHRVNLLDADFALVGIGVSFENDRQGNQRVYVTQNFMIPADPAP